MMGLDKIKIRPFSLPLKRKSTRSTLISSVLESNIPDIESGKDEKVNTTKIHRAKLMQNQNR